MDQIKDELVANLYSLRAGLSAVSLLADKLKIEEKTIDEEKSKIESLETEIRGLTSSVELLKNSVLSCRADYEKSKKEYSSSVEQELKSTLQNDSGYGISKMFAFALCMGIPIIGWIIALIMVKNSKKKVRQRIESQLERRLQNKKNNLEKQEDNLKEITVQRTIKQNQKEQNEKESNIIISKSTKEKEFLAGKAYIYKSSLENQYTFLLNPVDWENIDLIIYYLQTGRADSLKESLQLVDRQRQTEQIVDAINEASSRICATIRSGLTSLGKAMISCFNLLSKQIDIMGQEIISRQSKMITTLDNIQSTNQALLSATQLNNALQAKANVSSEQLIRDYEYINGIRPNF